MAYAFSSPVPPGKTDAVRRLVEESLGPRRAELDDLQRRSGIAEESYWLQIEPDGGATLIVVTDNNQSGFWQIMADPQTDFDRWYRNQIEAIWEFDAAGARPPDNELLGAWTEG